MTKPGYDLTRLEIGYDLNLMDQITHGSVKKYMRSLGWKDKTVIRRRVTYWEKKGCPKLQSSTNKKFDYYNFLKTVAKVENKTFFRVLIELLQNDVNFSLAGRSLDDQGKPFNLDPIKSDRKKKDIIRLLRQSNYSYGEIGRMMNISRQAVHKTVRTQAKSQKLNQRFKVRASQLYQAGFKKKDIFTWLKEMGYEGTYQYLCRYLGRVEKSKQLVDTLF